MSTRYPFVRLNFMIILGDSLIIFAKGLSGIYTMLYAEVNMKNGGGMEVSIELVELVGMKVQRGDGKACIEGEVHEKDPRISTVLSRSTHTADRSINCLVPASDLTS